MFSWSTRNSIFAFAAAVFCLAGAPRLLAAKCTAPPCITYTASGTFATPPISGTDIFKLAGQPFTLNVNFVSELLKPTSFGPTWAEYKKLNMTGTITTGLTGTPITLQSNNASLELANGNPDYDVFAIFVPVTVVSLQVQITATVQMPKGTFTKPLIGPFTAPVSFNTSNNSVTYSYNSSTTELEIASGTLSTAVSTALPAQ
jgi:hypothetical protein